MNTENARFWGNAVFAKEKAIDVCADMRGEVSPAARNVAQEALALGLRFGVKSI